MRCAAVALIVLAGFGCYCAPKIIETPEPPVHDVVALLPDPDSNAIGHVIVSSPLGQSVELTGDRAATRIEIGRPPSQPFTFSEAQVQQLFGDALAARPPAARHFLLYFESGSNRLTPDSEKQLAEVLVFVKARPVPDVSVIGHTDTTGAADANVQLGQNRATMIRDRLVAAGLDAGLVSVASHGEADLLIETPDNTAEPRNRRVEVSVR